MAADTETKPAAGIPLSEVEKHTVATDLWLVIDKKVYNVTPFFEEHPGGGEVMLQSAGRDGTDDFNDVGHSKQAKEMLKKYYIGEYAGGESAKPKSTKGVVTSGGNANSTAKLLQILLPIIVVLLAVGVFFVNTSK